MIRQRTTRWIKRTMHKPVDRELAFDLAGIDLGNTSLSGECWP